MDPRTGGKVAHGLRHEDLTRACQRDDTSGDVNGDPCQIGAVYLALAGVDAPALDGDEETADGHPNVTDLLGPGAPAPHVRCDPTTHLAVLPYSSGTTGNPKGVMLNHRNLVANVAQIRAVLDVTPDDRILAVLPFFHSYGLTVLLNAALHARARLVIMSRFDLVEFWRLFRTTSAPTLSLRRRWRSRWRSIRSWTRTSCPR
jgi:acyl-CoA synthetase (AMP-forming)/AMP-acid ligase II